MQEYNPKAIGAQSGVTEEMIRTLVHAFYARVRADPLLGPIFERAVVDWDHHLDKLCAFWSSVTLMTARYKGTPMKAHVDLPNLGRDHFVRWLELFEESATELCSAPAAAVFVDRSRRIAASLQLGVELHNGGISALKQTCPRP